MIFGLFTHIPKLTLEYRKKGYETDVSVCLYFVHDKKHLIFDPKFYILKTLSYPLYILLVG